MESLPYIAIKDTQRVITQRDGFSWVAVDAWFGAPLEFEVLEPEAFRIIGIKNPLPS